MVQPNRANLWVVTNPPLSSCADWSSLLRILRPFYFWHFVWCSPSYLATLNSSHIIMESDAMGIDTPYRSQFHRSRKVRITSTCLVSYIQISEFSLTTYFISCHCLLCNVYSCSNPQSSLRIPLSSEISSVSRTHLPSSPSTGNKFTRPRSLNVHWTHTGMSKLSFPCRSSMNSADDRRNFDMCVITLNAWH